MTPIVLWIMIALNATVLATGCVEWFKHQRSGLILAGALNTSSLMPILIGDGHPVWRYACMAVGLVLAASIFMRLRKTIRWRSLTILFGGAAIVLIILTELLTDVITGVPRAVTVTLASLVLVSFVSCLASMGWEMSRMFRRAREIRRPNV